MAIKDLKLPDGPMSGLVASAVEYMVDAGQRSVLFLDIMRQRGDQYREHVAQTAPHVLQYAAELITDGRKLDEPVNYALVRIVPPKDVEIDMSRRPFEAIRVALHWVDPCSIRFAAASAAASPAFCSWRRRTSSDAEVYRSAASRARTVSIRPNRTRI